MIPDARGSTGRVTRFDLGRLSRAGCWEMRALRDCVRLDAAAHSPATSSVTPVSKRVDLRGGSTGQLAMYGAPPESEALRSNAVQSDITCVC
jgi:hypothetical protein